MFAVVEIAGQQFKVSTGEKIHVNKLDEKTGSSINIDKVLLINNSAKTTLGKPHISNASVTAKILSHVKGKKVIVFKKKRRKGYRVKNGFRASLTEIEILKIIENTASSSKKAQNKNSGSSKNISNKPTIKSVSSEKTTTKIRNRVY